jgi:PAS domain S-box-containing protein
MPSATALLSGDLEVVAATDAYLRALGRRREDLLGRDLFEALRVPAGAELRIAFRECLETGQERVGFLALALEGPRWRFRNVPVPGPGGRPAWLLHTVEPPPAAVPDLRRTLEEAESRLRLFLDRAPTLAFLKDLEGRYVFANQVAARLAGLQDPSEMLGRTDEELFPPEVAARYREADRRVLTEGVPLQVEDAPPGPQARTLLTFKFPVEGPGGRWAGVGGIANDVTDLKKAEGRMEGYARQLERSNQDLQEFAYVASHDLQEPLRKIQMFSDRLMAKHLQSLPPEAQDYLQRMHGAARRMNVLIQDLLAYSRVSTKGQAFQEVDLRAEVDAVVADLDTRIIQVGADLRVGPLPRVHGDPTQLRQLFQNLLGNAFKYHRPDEPPRVEVRGWTDAAGRHVEVTDHGIGFDPEFKERIFAVFTRLHTREAYEGTGMGLAICRRIMDRHGGTLTAEGRPGEGATFTATFPN